MKSCFFRTLFGSLILASLAACGGSGDAVALSAEAPAQIAASPAAPAPSQAPMPVASACNDPSCLGGADGLADQFRAASMERAAQADASAQPGYPNVPSHAMTLAEARMPEALGTATLQRAQ
ncbi:hypothetical protein ACFSQU_12955 [Massilia sp. GCM10020059]|uniref:Lipoprotein n=1 Tax=Massilia agrisoli TaxID=2892444 RepID=A0ABS8IVJ5_9BURK|nr:hypothetical protein [Massilia agrisoli]MCC6072667.1 hypothetical protein [Massilia agrisoli]